MTKQDEIHQHPHPSAPDDYLISDDGRVITCVSCGREYDATGDEAFNPLTDRCVEECPQYCLGRDDGREGMICQDMVDGGFVLLESQYEPWVWEVAVWAGDHWSHEGDRIHLSHLKPAKNPDPVMIPAWVA